MAIATIPTTPHYHTQTSQWDWTISSANSRNPANHANRTTAVAAIAAAAETKTANTDITTTVRIDIETAHETTSADTGTNDTANATTARISVPFGASVPDWNSSSGVPHRTSIPSAVELNCGDDFLGIISADDPKGKSFTLQMAILDFDLEDI